MKHKTTGFSFIFKQLLICLLLYIDDAAKCY